MGEIRGWCGYCHFKKWKRIAAEDANLSVTIQLSIDDCGWDVYLHPSDIKMPDHVRRGSDDRDLPEVKYWKTWLYYERMGCWC